MELKVDGKEMGLLDVHTSFKKNLSNVNRGMDTNRLTDIVSVSFNMK